MAIIITSRWFNMSGFNILDLFVYLLCFPDDFPESTGVKRILQALNANVWSSVEMKDGEIF